MQVTMIDYLNGNAIQLTGKIFNDETGGWECEEFIWLEGAKKGKIGSRPSKAERDRMAAQSRLEREQMASAFKRLHVKMGTLK